MYWKLSAVVLELSMIIIEYYMHSSRYRHQSEFEQFSFDVRVLRLLLNSNGKRWYFCVLPFIRSVRIEFSILRIILSFVRMTGSVSKHAIAIALSQIHNK